jgi:hypothetical protein
MAEAAIVKVSRTTQDILPLPCEWECAEETLPVMMTFFHCHSSSLRLLPTGFIIKNLGRLEPGLAIVVTSPQEPTRGGAPQTNLRHGTWEIEFAAALLVYWRLQTRQALAGVRRSEKSFFESAFFLEIWLRSTLSQVAFFVSA